jgi:hypothetical protein
MGNRIVWKVLNKKQQEKILDEHRRWWEGNGGKQADLSLANLRGAKLKGALTIKATYQCGPQGNRYDVLVAFLCSDGEVYFSTGYIHAVGKKEFLAMVRGTHSDNDHAKKYALAVAHCVKMLESE